MGSRAYYNEIDPYAAQWLRNLIAQGRIAPGDVDERSIAEVRPDDLRGYRQVHLFAGIGGWSLAARLAGWPDDKPLWTGSCPCQPFSIAGRRRGVGDNRHLWPEMRRLVAECAPPTITGEQVASPLGREWLAGVRTDLEALGYAVGAADLCAAGVGAPHIRQRLYWVADAGQGQRRRRAGKQQSTSADSSERKQETIDDQRGGAARRLGNTEINGQPRQQTSRERWTGASHNGGLGNTGESRLEGYRRFGEITGAKKRAYPTGYASSASSTPWDGAIWIPCLDGKQRRIEPGIEPLAHGVPARMGKLRAYGNAIVPQLAAVFLEAVG